MRVIIKSMKELDFIEIINKRNNTGLLGDDCAFLKEFGIVISQDNFVENVHFKREWATPYQTGYKACAVNISDILASGGKPEYITNFIKCVLPPLLPRLQVFIVQRIL